MTAHRAGWRACSWLIFLLFFWGGAQKNWPSYEALSQQRGIEPAMWHWASNEGMVNLYCAGPMDFPMQPLQLQQIKLLINSGTIWDKIEDWQPIHMYTFITPTVINRVIMVNLRQHQFSWGRRIPLSWREIGTSKFRCCETGDLRFGHLGVLWRMLSVEVQDVLCRCFWLRLKSETEEGQEEKKSG